MDAQYLSSLEETLKQTLLPDSNTIKQASSRLTKEFYTNDLALPSLFQILQNTQDDQMKQLAAVEVRKLVLTKWEGLDGSLKTAIRSALLESVFQQSTKRIRNSMARVISTIAELDLEKDEWPEILPSLVNTVQSNDAATKETAVYILYTLLETQVPELAKHVPDFLDLFSSLVNRGSSMEIRVNSLLALSVLSQFIESEEDIDANLAAKFRNSIPQMVEVLQDVVQNDDSDSARQVFNVFNELIFVDSKLVGDYFIDLIQLAIQLSSNTEIDETYRVFALQFLISCVTIRKSKITSGKLGPQITIVAAKIASEEIDIEEELSNEDEENENEENSPPSLGLRLIAVLAASLPPSQVIQTLFENMDSMLSSPNQFERRASLLCLGVSSSGAPDFFWGHIEKIIGAIVRGLKDPEIIVRVAALRSLSQLSTELNDAVSEYHSELLPIIIDIIDSATSVMAYKYACFALDGLIEYMPLEAMDGYLEPLMNKLFHMLQQANSSSLKSAIVSAIGSTAFAGGKSFTPYFNTSVEYLEPFISNAVSVEGMSEDDIELRALTFENISTMARAVGSEAFSRFAKPLVESAYASLSSEHARIRESGFAFISNMAKVYGAEFAGFLDQIVPQILKCLEQEEFTVNFNEDDEFNDDDEGGENDFGVNTGIAIEKDVASIALYELALATGKEFSKFVEPSINVLVNQLEVSFGMRVGALNALWKILTAMFNATYGKDFKAPIGVPSQPYVDGSILQLIEKVRDLTLDLLESDFEVTVVASALENLVEAIGSFGSIAIVSNAQENSPLERLCVQLMSIIKREHQCLIEDEDAVDEEEDLSETDDLLFDSALEVLIGMSTKLGGDFNKIFAIFKDVIFANATSKSKSKRTIVIGFIAEVANGLKQENAYSEEMLQLFLERLTNDKALNSKGHAAYGVEVIVENSSTDLSSLYPTILQLLYHLLNKTDKRANTVDDEETKEAVNRSFANACGCVATMAIKNQQAVPLEHVLPPLLNHLPLETALEENVPIFSLILQLYDTNNEIIFGVTPKIVEIFGKVFLKEKERMKLITHSTLGREQNIDDLKQFQKEGLKEKVIELLKFLDTKYAGVVSSNEVLKEVIA